MTLEEYKNLKRFSKPDDTSSIRFETGDIFEILTLCNNTIYARISDAWEGLLFDLVQCTPEGEKVRMAIRRNSLRRSEIINRLQEADWRLYKTNRQ